MQILLLGTGTVTARLNLALAEQGHRVVGQLADLTPAYLDLFDCRALLVVSPEAAVSSESLVKAAERGRLVFLIAGTGDGLAAWAGSAGVPAFAYPPSSVEMDRLLGEIRRAEAGNLAADDQYRRAVLGGDLAARLQSGMAVRKIAVTSPKGGTGKTTIAANLAVGLALSGITTYLVDADANAGALQYHLRLKQARTTLISLLRREMAQSNAVLAPVARGAAYLESFTVLDDLPTLKVLPGLVTDDLGDQALQDEERISDVLHGLFEAGVAAGGVVVMDVGINPAHVVHRAALRLSEGIAIVIRPEIPDLAETRRWMARMIASLSGTVGREAACEFIGSRVKLCYNQVLGDSFKSAHHLLEAALREEHIQLGLAPNGVLPLVAPRLAAQAVNSDRIEDILIWRYKKEHLEELGPFAEALISFSTHFVPAVREGAARAGLLSTNGKQRRWFKK